MTRTRTTLRALGISMLLVIGIAAARAQEVTTTYPVLVACTPPISQLCNPPFTVPVTTTATLVAEFTASPSHCSEIRVRYLVDGVVVTGFSEPLAPGESTGEVDLGPVASGAHTVGVQAMGVLGGCNTGGLGLWAGELDVTTSILVGPPLTLAACKNGGWQTFNNPVFKNQGDCVSFVATQGRNPGQ